MRTRQWFFRAALNVRLSPLPSQRRGHISFTAPIPQLDDRTFEYANLLIIGKRIHRGCRYALSAFTPARFATARQIPSMPRICLPLNGFPSNRANLTGISRGPSQYGKAPLITPLFRPRYYADLTRSSSIRFLREYGIDHTSLVESVPAHRLIKSTSASPHQFIDATDDDIVRHGAYLPDVAQRHRR